MSKDAAAHLVLDGEALRVVVPDLEVLGALPVGEGRGGRGPVPPPATLRHGQHVQHLGVGEEEEEGEEGRTREEEEVWVE